MLRAAALAVVLLFAAPTVADDGATAGREAVIYGDPIDLAGEAVEVQDVLAEPSAFAGKTVLIRGTIESVCQTRGCWVRLMPAGEKAASLTPGMDNAFIKLVCEQAGQLVPADSAGAVALVRGEVTVEEIDEATARHYAQDAGASEDEVAKIVGPQKTVRVSSPGVAVVKADAAE